MLSQLWAPGFWGVGLWGGGAWPEAVIDWPSAICNPWVIKPKSLTSTVATPFDGGYTQTRPRYTRVLHQWVLGWKYLPDAQMAAMVTFFEETAHGMANSFTWRDPKSKSPYTVRFGKDELERELVDVGLWDVEIQLNEV